MTLPTTAASTASRSCLSKHYAPRIGSIRSSRSPILSAACDGTRHAAITATGLDTHNKNVAYSGADGAFAFHALPAGRYLIEVRVPGFKLLQQTQTVADGSNVVFNPTLELGQVNETIDIVGQ